MTLTSHPSRLTLLFALFFSFAAAAQPATTTTPQNTAPAAELRPIDAVILGVVEGITEFLPISSTGHLIIANDMLGLEDDRPLKDADGKPLWYKKPSEKYPGGVPLTLKLAADTYTVVIQAGAILAVIFLYWSQIAKILRGMIGRDPDGLRLLRNLLGAFIPIAVIGLISHDWINKHLFSVGAVIVAQISGAVLMIAAERWRRDAANVGNSGKEAADMSLPGSLGIGFMQCLALWPGMSRSMVTIVGGYFNRLSPAKAAEFSFLVGLPVLGGAAFVKTVKSGSAMISVFGWNHVILGIVVAAISAALAVKFLVHFLSRHGLFVFALYRLALAVVLGLWFMR